MPRFQRRDVLPTEMHPNIRKSDPKCIELKVSSFLQWPSFWNRMEGGEAAFVQAKGGHMWQGLRNKPLGQYPWCSLHHHEKLWETLRNPRNDLVLFAADFIVCVDPSMSHVLSSRQLRRPNRHGRHSPEKLDLSRPLKSAEIRWNPLNAMVRGRMQLGGSKNR